MIPFPHLPGRSVVDVLLLVLVEVELLVDVELLVLVDEEVVVVVVELRTICTSKPVESRIWPLPPSPTAKSMASPAAATTVSLKGTERPKPSGSVTAPSKIEAPRTRTWTSVVVAGVPKVGSTTLMPTKRPLTV
jgi:hypothetical protein